MNVDNSKLPKDIKDWLNARQISDSTLTEYGVSWDGYRIVIPVRDMSNTFLFNKKRKNPATIDDSPKYLYDKGSTIQIYNGHKLKEYQEVIICEGEFDCLILLSKGFNAVTSTGGATSFQEAWAPYFKDKDVYVCLDNDKAGELGILKICKILPHAKVVFLPSEVGEHGDITDYFVKCAHSINDFRFEMSLAKPHVVKTAPPEKKKKWKKADGTKLEQAKSVPIENYLKFNSQGYAKCPFHDEKTASLKKYPNNKFYCYGCGAHGDVIDLLCKQRGISMKEAVGILAG